METFEFLSVLQIHGFPRLLGVATHLDYIKDNKQKKKMKKELRKRFEIEVPPESKLFFIKGMKNNLYDFRDIHNLTRFVSVIIPRPLEFKKNHPHILIDRFEMCKEGGEDLNRKAGDVLVFGYLRGADLRIDSTQKDLLMSGLGVVEFDQFKTVNDPCPVLGRSMKGKNSIQPDRRKLERYEKMIYAPQSNLGMTLFDETGDYVNIPENHVVFTERKKENDL